MSDTYKSLQGGRFPSALNLAIGDEYDDPRVGPDHELFDHPPAKFLDEIRCMKFIQAVLNKPDWKRKLNSSEIVSKWRVETKDYQLRKEVFDYAIEELKWLASVSDDASGIEPTGVDFVWRSDEAVSEELHTDFQNILEKYASTLPEKDYHPGSNDQVVNIVHPSLFCLVYGQSTDTKGDPIQLTDKIPPPAQYAHMHTYPTDIRHMWSKRYQWLPSEFLIDEEGKVKISSYINNLPFYAGLYSTISEIFELAIPLFNRVLSELRAHHGRTRFPLVDGYTWWESEDPPPEIYEGIANNDWDQIDAVQEEWSKNRVPIPLPIPDFDPTLFDCARDQIVDLRGCRLQVIVKIGSIELTPEKPSFKGGNWHVEGMANEKIVATAIYYYDSENIEGDCLNFRQSVELDTAIFAQDDEQGAETMFGISRDDAMVQDAGTVQTPTGRMLVFPNIYQHALGSFKLKDGSKPGHRKILVFFLVDPTQRIVSTASVPPQNVAWRDPGLVNKVVDDLPPEVAVMITKQIGYEMTLEEAKEHRLKLMEERSVAKDVVTQAIFERPFDLCEH